MMIQVLKKRGQVLIAQFLADTPNVTFLGRGLCIREKGIDAVPCHVHLDGFSPPLLGRLARGRGKTKHRYLSSPGPAMVAVGILLCGGQHRQGDLSTAEDG